MEEIIIYGRKFNVTEEGKIFSSITGKQYSSHIGKWGYYYFTTRINGNVVTLKNHKLVALAYLPNPENLPQINHKNGIKTDNHISNLEWCTAKHNTRHAFDTGLRCGHDKIINVGINNGKAKLTETQILEIRELKNKHTQTEIGKMYGISQVQISRILNNKTWNYL